MNHNKDNQGYDILDRFKVLSNGIQKEYCRVKFSKTKNEQVVPSELVESGRFTDSSIVKAVDLNSEYKTELNSVDMGDKLPTFDGLLGNSGDSIVFDVYRGEDDNEDKDRVIIITTPSSDEIEINEIELFNFCKDNELDFDVVLKVLNEEQNTHKKYKFKYKQ